VGALPHLVRLLEHSPCPDTPAQCAWALSNVTGDGAQARDLVRGEGVCEALQRMFGPGGRARGGGGGGGGALVKQCAWLASNLFRAKPYPPLTPAREALLPVLVRWAAEGGEAATDAAWALAYISDGGGGSVDACARHGVAAAVVPLCAPRGAPAALVTPALRVVGNFLSGSEANTDAALAAGALRAMPALLARGERGIRKEALWAISNVCAGSPAQAVQVDAEGLWPTVLNCVSDGQAAVAREAAWCVSNLLSHPAALTRGVVGMGALGALNAFLARAPPPEERDVRCVLEGLGKLLEGAVREDPHLLRAARDASEESGLGDRVMALFETGGFPSARGVLRDLGAYILDGEGGSEEGEEER
jgi:importin subunit alpha-1